MVMRMLMTFKGALAVTCSVNKSPYKVSQMESFWNHFIIKPFFFVKNQNNIEMYNWKLKFFLQVH